MFTRRFLTLLAGTVLLAAVLAPAAATALFALDFHYPLPRIFDRVVMITLIAALVLDARRLGLPRLLRAGFVPTPPGGKAAAAGAVVKGLVLAAGAIGLLWGTALILSETTPAGGNRELIARLPGYMLSAIFIAVGEETFFRAFLLGGFKSDYGARMALVLSALVYALAHLLRAPARFYLARFEPLAGFANLGLIFNQLAHPLSVMPAFIGLFLLGLLLGEIFIVSGTVYFSIGVHAGLVLGAKSWRLAAPVSSSLPGWLVGYESPPLISGPGAWVIIIFMLVAMRRHTGRSSGLAAGNRAETGA